MSIGNRIKELLTKQEISQKDLARYIGTTEASISRYVNDEREPVAKILYKIAQELHTTTDYLISGTDDSYEQSYWLENYKADSFARMYDLQKSENMKLERQISVLEKALKKACESIDSMEYCKFDSTGMVDCEDSCLDCFCNYFKSQAEKEVVKGE